MYRSVVALLAWTRLNWRVRRFSVALFTMSRNVCLERVKVIDLALTSKPFWIIRALYQGDTVFYPFFVFCRPQMLTICQDDSSTARFVFRFSDSGNGLLVSLGTRPWKLGRSLLFSFWISAIICCPPFQGSNFRNWCHCTCHRSVSLQFFLLLTSVWVGNMWPPSLAWFWGCLHLLIRILLNAILKAIRRQKLRESTDTCACYLSQLVSFQWRWWLFSVSWFFFGRMMMLGVSQFLTPNRALKSLSASYHLVEITVLPLVASLKVILIATTELAVIPLFKMRSLFLILSLSTVSLV